jgi:hypothetical protein
MTQELEMITNLEDLETFIVAAENGGFGLTNVAINSIVLALLFLIRYLFLNYN